VTIDTTTPSVGSGTLEIVTTSSVIVSGWNAYLDTPFSKGFTKGRIRTLLGTGNSGAFPINNFNMNAGIIFMQSQLNLSEAGNCYCFGWGSTNTAAWRFSLFRLGVNQGLDQLDDGEVVFYQATFPNPSVDDFYPIEVEWNLDEEELGGVRLTGRIGTLNSTDFGTLSDVVDTVDGNDYLTTSVAEGIYFRKGDTDGTGRIWRWDETTIWELT
jgi:hypothetical protein